MNCERFEKQINDYLDNHLDQSKKIEFENYLNENSEFKKIVDDIKYNNDLLRQIPKISASSDFIVKLNNKIEMYENNNRYSWINLFENKFFKLKTIPLIGVLSIFVIVSFSLYKISDYSFIDYITDNKGEDTSFAINDADSLNNINSDVPILLIGNEK
tara:strand:- start:25 stop:498 length:474 start_codon:yes stop_codon:yes gene_type:complete